MTVTGEQTGNTVTDDEITDLLFVREEPIAADLAMVFGAANEIDLARRTHRGVQLYHDRFVSKLVVTGAGHPKAKRMADALAESRTVRVAETFGSQGRVGRLQSCLC